MDAIADKIDATALEKAYAQAGVAPPSRKRATEDEKKILRGSIVRKATQEEADAWVAQNIRFLTQKAQNAFSDMNDEDQFRVMSEGPMTECRDATEILYGRVKRFMDMEAKLKSMANVDPSAVEKSRDKKTSDVALEIARQMSMPLLEEVPENERRFGTVAGTGPPVVDVPKAPEKVLIGTRQGVGGVIEALQKKYMMQKGDRGKVIAETKELWKMEGDINVPKTHKNTGWKWVIQGEEAAALKKAEEKVRKQQDKEEAEQRKAEEEKCRKEAKRKEEAAQKSRSIAKESKKKKSRQRSNSRSQLSPSRSRADRKSKDKSKRRKDHVPSDASSRASSQTAARKRKRKCSQSHSSASARRGRRR